MFALILTVDGQLHHQLVIVGRGTVELVLDGSFVFVSKHLGAVAADFELSKVSLQILDDLAVLLRTHFCQLNTEKYTEKQTQRRVQVSPSPEKTASLKNWNLP